MHYCTADGVPCTHHAGAGYTEFEQGIDEALNTTWTACCKQAEPVVWSKHRECTFLDVRRTAAAFV